MARQIADRGIRLAAALVCAAAAATVAGTVAAVWRFHVALPYWDEWQTITDFRRLADGTYGLADLARQHNEHRLVLPRLVFFADEMWCGLSGRLDQTVTLALQASNAAVLAVLAARRTARAAHRALLCGFVVLLLFTLRQEQNFSNGFQVQFVGVCSAAILAAVAYGAALERSSSGRTGSGPLFAVAGLACAASACTMANGVLAGFVLAAAAVLARAPARVAGGTLALSALLAAAFFRDYRPGGDSLPSSALATHVWACPRFGAAYLGNPLGPDVRAAQGFGLERPGCPIHYWLSGPEGRPLVVLTHGACVDHTEFDGLAPLLARRYRVLTWDVRGHGWSRPARGGFAVDRAVDDLLALLDVAGYGEATLVGHSLGGNLGQEVVFRAPDRVTALVLVGCTCNTCKLSRWEALQVRIAVPLLRLLPYGFLKRQSARASTVRPEVRAYLERVFGRLSKDEFTSILARLVRCLHYEPGYRIGKPLLLMHGAADRTGNVRDVAPTWAAREGASCQYVVIPAAGHMANLDNPELFNRALLDFLQRHVPVGG